MLHGAHDTHTPLFHQCTRREQLNNMKLLQLFALAACAFGASVHGTTNGYDQEDGENAICWNIMPNNTNTTVEAAFDTIPDVFKLRKTLYRDSKIEMMESCFDGLAMTLAQQINSEKDRRGIIYNGNEVTFNANISVAPYIVNDTYSVSPNRVVWRIKLCDATRIGFCTPFSRDTGVVDDDSAQALEGDNVSDVKQKPPNYFTSRMSFLDLNQTELQLTSLLTFSTSVSCTVPENVVGSFYAIGHAAVFYGSDEPTEGVFALIDMANAIDGRIVTIKDPPPILEPSRHYKIGISVVLGIIGLFELALLAALVIYRQNAVMKLSQAPFLVLMLLCSMTATGSCILYIPTNDLYCNLWSPLILLPVNMMAAILVARMWRMYFLLSISLRLSLIAKRRTYEAKFMSVLTFLASWQELLGDKLAEKYDWAHRRRSSSGSSRRISLSRSALRKEVKTHHVLQLIATLMLPQIIIQIVTLSLYPATVELVETDSLARVACTSETQWTTLVGFLLIVFTFLVAVLVAWISRDLPSLFNEKNQVFKASWINFVVMFFFAVMYSLTDFSSSSPDVHAFVWTAGTLCTALTPCIYVILPLAVRAYKGETVVMSRLFASSSEISGSRRKHQEEEDGSPSSPPVHHSREFANDGSSGDKPANDSLEEPVIVIQRYDPPPRKLEFQLLSMKETVGKISASSLEGRSITKTEWTTLQERTEALHSHLQRLRFAWEDEESLRPEEAASGAVMSGQPRP